MKISMPKIIKRINLAEYAPEMDTTIDVWINPTRGMMLEFHRLRALSEALPGRLALLAAELDKLPEDAVEEREKIDEERKQIGEELNAVGAQMAEWHATIWSQGPDKERHWSVEEVIQLMESTAETDPMLFAWLMVQTQKMIAIHRTDIKKA